MEKAVSKQAGETFALLQKEPSKAASMLMKRLLSAQEGGVTMEDIAYTLAEQLMGNDEKYETTLATQRMPSSRKKKPATQRKNTMVVTVTASVGRNSKLAASHFVSAIADVLDISGADIGKIDIKDSTTKVGLYEEDALNLLELRKPVRIKGSDVSFTMGPADFGHRGKRSSGKRPDFRTGKRGRKKMSSRERSR